MGDETVIQRINEISHDELGRTYGVRMKVNGVTAECNHYRTTKENAMACFRAVKAMLPPEQHYWGLDRFTPYPKLEISTFESR